MAHPSYAGYRFVAVTFSSVPTLAASGEALVSATWNNRSTSEGRVGYYRFCFRYFCVLFSLSFSKRSSLAVAFQDVSCRAARLHQVCRVVQTPSLTLLLSFS
jgi:hypothetical protein